MSVALQLQDAKDRLSRAALTLRASDTLGCALNIAFCVAAIGINAEKINKSLAEQLDRKGFPKEIVPHIRTLLKASSMISRWAGEGQQWAAALWTGHLAGQTVAAQEDAKQALTDAIGKL